MSYSILSPAWVLLWKVTQLLLRFSVHPLPAHMETQNTCLCFFVIPLFPFSFLYKIFFFFFLPQLGFTILPRLTESYRLVFTKCVNCYPSSSVSFSGSFYLRLMFMQHIVRF